MLLHNDKKMMGDYLQSENGIFNLVFDDYGHIQINYDSLFFK